MNVFGRTQVIYELDAHLVSHRVNRLCSGFDGWNGFARLTHFRDLDHITNPTLVRALFKSDSNLAADPDACSLFFS